MPFSSMLFPYKVDEMPRERNLCLYQLAYGKGGFVTCRFALSCRTYLQC